MNWFGAISGAMSAWVQSWGERKKIEIVSKTELQKIKADTAAAVEVARLKRLENAQVAEIEWDLRAMENARTSWKDELMTIVLVMPFVGIFFPQTQKYVIEGFEALARGVPVWYTTSFGVVVAASFGYRGIVSAYRRFGPSNLKL